MRKTCILLICLLLFAIATPVAGAAGEDSGGAQGGSVTSLSDAQIEQEAKKLILLMNLEQKVNQLFFLPLADAEGEWFTQPGEGLEQYIKETQAGGYVLFGGNVTDRQGTAGLVDAVVGGAATTPFVGIDEEGGIVSRLSEAGLPGYVNGPTAREIGQTGDTVQAYGAGRKVGGVLRELHINVDFAPVADVDAGSVAIGSRSYGADAQLVADMAAAFQRGLHSEGVLTAPKHFPGHGGAAADSHEGAAVLAISEEEMREVYIPFIKLAQEGAQFIMVGHISAPGIDPQGLPASVSPYFITEVLRGELGYEGIVITDAMDMGAITQLYAPDEAAVQAILAGADMLLVPEDWAAAQGGVKQAVKDGRISLARLQESLVRIVSAKIKYGIIDLEKV